MLELPEVVNLAAVVADWADGVVVDETVASPQV
jgi:hypothetical protein